MSHTISCRSEADTVRLGECLATCLPDGTVVGLNGTLGAGKTRLVQAVAAASGIADGIVVSPTFTLCNEYHGQRTIYHMDLYRLADEDEWIELGVEEYFDTPALIFIEWSDRFTSLLPDDRMELQIEVITPTERRVTITAYGQDLAMAADKVVALFTE